MMGGAGLSPGQVRARAAEAMAFERSQRPLTPVEQRVRRRAEAEARQVREREWCVRNLPDLVQADGWPCSYALLALADARRWRPDIESGSELVAYVRKVRAWRMGGAGDDSDGGVVV